MIQPDERARVLIVEDEWMIASQIHMAVQAAGFDVVGPIGELTPALALAHAEDISAALLDIQLGPGIDVYPVADALRDRRIPFAFVSSLPRDQISSRHADRPLVAKPFQPAAIELTVGMLTNRRR